MGGKSQQRVAGNAKPSNSGRIRGLLVNQQLGASNIITFSALTAKRQQQQQQEQNVLQAVVSKPASILKRNVNENSDINEPSTNEGSVNERSGQQVSFTPQNSSPPPATNKDGTRLIVKRVGNRDFYTRVRFSEDIVGTSEETGQLSAVNPSDAGVKKPPANLTTSQASTEHDPIKPESPDNVEVDSDDDAAVEVLKEEDPDEELDFDGLLDRLDQVRVLIDRSTRIESLRQLDEKSVSREIEMLKLFGILFRKYAGDLSIEDWDLFVNSLNKWIKWITKTDYPLHETNQASLCASVFNFIHQIIIYAEKFKKDDEEAGGVDGFPMLRALLDDWANFKSSTMFLDLIELFLKLIAADNSEQTHSNPTIRPMLDALAHIIVTVDPRMVLSHHNLSDYLDTRIEFDPEYKKPKNSIYCTLADKKLKTFLPVCGLMRSNFRVILMTAHAILSKTMDGICENAQSSTLIQDHEDVDDMLIFPPAPLMAVLTSRDSMMSALLSEYRLGGISVTIEPNTDSYGCTLSYLFAWDLTIQFIVGVDKEVGQCIIHSFKKLGLIQRLLDNIFILLPPLDVRDSLNFKIESSDSENSGSCRNDSPKNITDFLKMPLATTIKRPINEIELVALHLYFSVASHMPVTVRKWYNNNTNKRLCNLVNEYTVKHISHVICAMEMESVQEKCQERAARELNPKSLIIKARPSAKEVYALYTRDEFKIELTIKLPLNYPLGAVQIDGGKRVGVTDVKWRSWLLQLTTFLSHQNGPILDGIELWRKNIDKRFEGVEKCTICFSILHSNYQLPKKKCQTCANMFHNICLYKWFESSGNSTCPLCRNPW